MREPRSAPVGSSGGQGAAHQKKHPLVRVAPGRARFTEYRRSWAALVRPFMADKLVAAKQQVGETGLFRST